MDSCQRGDVLTMTDITRRDFLKLLTATTAALVLPIAIVGETLHLDIEVDEDKLKEAISIKPWGGYVAEAIVYDQALSNADIAEVHNYLSKKHNVTLRAELDQGKMWQAVSAIDQRGRVWTTPDGKAWSCGADSFTLEG